ncbi:hypothetical protein SAMN05444920_103121 [Nonomuraea solani]|uniref:Xaa-Pro dipeptidyl-peptidase C-terminal domain-containing protein n=1 Tax=Nonomuraea solani TaxID=1144553 RepID=A0A1H6B4F1_9ACTN|nr:CocE/NonD family hydrolase [Nonomuraea solani]SEG55255.1 hypothetical protein SAMN05444920_103121 [Nonomuraea solani]
MRSLTLALTVALTLSLTPAATAAAQTTEPPSDPFFSYDRPAQYGVHRERVTVPLRDGSHLACDLHRPAAPDGEPAPGRFPGIVYDYNAYDQLEAQGRAAAYFVERGYAAAICNVRGSGDSPGHLDPFSGQEQRDNYDLIEWLAAQPWSTGRIGQTGVSYGGHSSLLVAVNKPPHLTAIIPVDGISDWYENTIYRGGIYSARIRDWQRSVAPDTLRTYAEHPLYDDFWRERSVKSRWKDLDVPVLEIAGWYDRYRQGMVDNFQARKQNVWLVAGPWVHGWPAGQPADIGNGAYLAWWDRWLARRPGTPLPAAKITSYETPGTGWRQFQSWPPPGTRGQRLGLGADGRLSADPGAPATRTFEVNTQPAAGGAGQRLSFTTGPLERDLVLAGEIQARVRASFTASDGNIAVVVEDTAPDGTATRVTQGWLKASHRQGHERLATVRPGKVYDLDIRTWPVNHRVAAGHGLRVTVSSDDYPEIDSDAPAGRVGLKLGRGGSAITLTSVRATPPS